ncbi:hypothetical protein ASPBRDRAFT_58861 [Aspergillus brasiliensis CBS 101740]|uniref:4-hydroxy-2-oxoglutarate aldolase, mitochondrial n=1 Tax=Aspergillus brasiliensis (strain CBS 101740 / IMI 381727 / IBT 21946) TaxID=767769 RepID=A0A1L9U7Y7_ASPBC|nr:hypothetical protein ASPBRDRAFT_58861 [Aspergillus brasiliensis CBS 101740]
MSAPPTGVWCPVVTFYDAETGLLDLEAQRQYDSYLSKTGLAGLVILGTNAEAFLLTREERAQLIATAREAVGLEFPLMAGVSGFSTIQVLQLIDDAHKAGANYALLLPPSYPLPIIIYNFPGVCNGIDLDSETIAALAKRHPGKIVGVKLTCGNVGKITRLGAELHPKAFSIFGGQSDFLLGGLAVGSAGCISAFANVFPKTVSEIYRLHKIGRTDEALRLHQRAALAESPCKAGIASTKYAVAIYSAPAAGIQQTESKLRPRAPYSPISEFAKEHVKALMGSIAEVEESL